MRMVKGVLAIMVALEGWGADEGITPNVISCHEPVDRIFGIQIANAVGTIDIGNQVTALELHKEGVRTRRLATTKSIPLGVSRLHFPVLSSGRFACWTQGRALLYADVEAGSLSYAIVGTGFEESVRGIEKLTDSPLRVILDISHRDERRVRRRLLRVVEIKNGDAYLHGEQEIGTVSYGYNPPWAITGGAVLVCGAGKPTLDAYDLRLQPVKHPLATLVNDKDMLRRLTEMVVHPHLPFAVLIDRSAVANERYLLYCARWDGDNAAVRPIPVALDPNADSYYSHATFSPDGTWMVCRDDTEDDMNPELIAFPVDEKSPTYLGKPMRLGGCVAGELTSTAWAVEPTTFVACGGGVLHCWRMDTLRR